MNQNKATFKVDERVHVDLVYLLQLYHVQVRSFLCSFIDWEMFIVVDFLKRKWKYMRDRYKQLQNDL